MALSFATGAAEDVAFSFATGVPEDVAFSFATGVPEDAVFPLICGGSAVHIPAAVVNDFEGAADDSPGTISDSSGTGPWYFPWL